MDALRNRKIDGLTAEFELRIPQDLTIQADAERLKQVFFNLLMNAMESKKVGDVKIEVEGVKEKDNISIYIRDDGPGVPPDLKKKIFDPFFTTKSSGTGLGLSTVAQIMKGMHGGISLLEAEPGSQFHLTFPIEKESK